MFVHEVLMYDVNKEARYIGTKYSVQVDPLYFEWDKLIPTLEKHLLDILIEILNHDNQRYAQCKVKVSPFQQIVKNSMLALSVVKQT